MAVKSFRSAVVREKAVRLALENRMSGAYPKEEEFGLKRHMRPCGCVPFPSRRRVSTSWLS